LSFGEQLKRLWQDHIREWTASICVLLSTVAFTVAGFWDASWRWYLFAIGVLLGLIAVWVQVTQVESYKEMRHELEEIKKREEAKKRVLTRTLSALAYEISKQHTLWDSDTRVTVYGYHEGEEVFIPLVRRSYNPVYERLGRPRYVQKQGYLYEAWQLGFYSQTFRKEQARREMLKNKAMTREEVEALTMSPREVIGMRLDCDGKKLGVLLFETMKPGIFSSTLKDSLEQASEVRTLRALMFAVAGTPDKVME